MILTLGRCDPQKSTLDIMRAFELAKEKIPLARLVVAGLCDGPYGDKVRGVREVSRYKKDITITGPVSQEKKIDLMREAAVVCMASVKEGWGLVITEANSQGTPAVVYDVDGLRDSVKNRETGLMCEANPGSMAQNIIKLLGDRGEYEQLRKAGWEWSKEMTFERSYKDFLNLLT